MKVAFIGASHWHLPLYLDPLREVPGATLAGISDPDPTKAAALGQALGCPADRDYRELCRRVKPDFIIALGRHADMAEEAAFLIGENIPFALEKPCGLDTAEVSGIAAAAARAGAFAAVPLVFRNGDFLRGLRDVAAKDGIQHAAFRFIAGFPSRYRDAGCDWMLDPALSGGGCTINLAVHFFDICRLIWGDQVRPVAATMSNAAWQEPIEDYSSVVLGNGSALCTIETGYLYPAPTSTFDLHYAIRTPDHYMVVSDPDGIDLFDRAGNRTRRTTHTTNVAHYRTFVFDVLERAAKGRPPLASLADMVPLMGLIDEAYGLAKISSWSPR